MHGWGGPLPDSWHVKQVELQHKILARMRAFGMLPVLPAFTGYVPDAVTRLFPLTNATRIRDWKNFPPTYCWCVNNVLTLTPSLSVLTQLTGHQNVSLRINNSESKDSAMKTRTLTHWSDNRNGIKS